MELEDHRKKIAELEDKKKKLEEKIMVHRAKIEEIEQKDSGEHYIFVWACIPNKIGRRFYGRDKFVFEIYVKSLTDVDIKKAYLRVCPPYACDFIATLLGIGRMDWEDLIKTYQRGSEAPLTMKSKGTRTLGTKLKTKLRTKDKREEKITVPNYVRILVSAKNERYLMETIIPDLINKLGDTQVSEILNMLEYGIEHYRKVYDLQRREDGYIVPRWIIKYEEIGKK